MRFLLSTTLALGLALAGSVAYAQTSPDEDPQDIQGQPEGMATPEVTPSEREAVPVEPEPKVKIEQDIDTEPQTGAYGGAYMAPQAEQAEMQPAGIQVLAGGGIFNYSHSAARDVTSLGADYTARIGFATNRPLAFEVAYVGSAQATNALGLDTAANLISNGVEGVARVNLLTGNFRPYVIGGAAWKRYNLINDDFNTSVINNEDSVVEFPVGVGMAYHFSKFLLDARSNYRFATDEQLIGSPGNEESLDNWDINLKAGVEF